MKMKQYRYSLGQLVLLEQLGSSAICDGICIEYASTSSQSFQYGKINDDHTLCPFVKEL